MASEISNKQNLNYKNMSTSICSNDEIIEEGFVYSEADLLDELNTSEANDGDADANDTGEDDEHNANDGNINNEKYVNNQKVNNRHNIPNKTITVNKGEKAKEVTANLTHINSHTSATADNATHTNDNNDNLSNVAANIVDNNCVPFVNADNATTTKPNDKHTSTPPTHKLQLRDVVDDESLTIVTAGSGFDSFCPITPRRIIDVEDEPNQFLNCNVTNNITKNNNNNADQTKDATSDVAAVNVTGHNDRNDDEGYYYADEPEDELIVQFLGEANRIAEARLAARRQARAEAREIRMRELERQQKEQEQNADRVFDMHTVSGIDSLSRLAIGVGSSPLGALVLNSTRANSMSSRRSSEDSLEEEGRNLRDIRHELKDVEERFRKAMIANAQLDNERASQTYQIQLLKDKLEEVEESYAQLQREFKEKSRDCNALKRNLDKLSEELKLVQGQLTERDNLIEEQGLVIVAIENDEGTDAKRALVSVENAQLLGSVQGSLDVRVKRFSEEKHQLLTEVQKLQETLESYKAQGKGGSNSLNGPSGSDEDYEAQREANKIISDYKYKLQKAEQEIASLQASLARSETQVIRYKSTAEAAEKAEAELKIERRKLQRENREAMERLEELETSNNHLLKRLDKLKNAKSALLKEL
ncbi:leucine-rich repeat flightless-interacting protein 2 isoform X2 [Eurosta solidaginis]